MIRFSNTVEIDRSISEVFAYLGDLEHVPQWNWAVTATRRVGEGPIGVGTEYVQTRSVPKHQTERLRITTFDPPHAIAIEGTLGPFPARISYRLHGTEGHTSVVNEIELDPPGVLGIAAPILSRRIQGSVADNLGVLKSLLEKPHVARS